MRKVVAEHLAHHLRAADLQVEPPVRVKCDLRLQGRVGSQLCSHIQQFDSLGETGGPFTEHASADGPLYDAALELGQNLDPLCLCMPHLYAVLLPNLLAQADLSLGEVQLSLHHHILMGWKSVCSGPGRPMRVGCVHALAILMQVMNCARRLQSGCLKLAHSAYMAEK